MAVGTAGVTPMVTDAVYGEPIHPKSEVGVIVYTTVPCTVPRLDNTSLIVVPHPKAQELYPTTVPNVFVADQVNVVPEGMPTDKSTPAEFPSHITCVIGVPEGVGFTLTC